MTNDGGDVPPGLINLLFGGVVLGEVGYRAYGDSVGWKNYLGRPMPVWGDLPEAIRAAWDRAAYVIVNEATRLYDQGTVECVCEHPSTGCECGAGG